MKEETKQEIIEVHLKEPTVFWSDGAMHRMSTVKAPIGNIHLEVVDGESMVVLPIGYNGGTDGNGMPLPIKESAEWVAEVKARQPRTPDVIRDFIEEYNDYLQSDDKENWMPKWLKGRLKKKGMDV